MTRTVKLNNKLVINVYGDYDKGEPEVGIGQSFEVESIEMVEGDIVDLILWLEVEMKSKTPLLSIFEDRALHG